MTLTWKLKVRAFELEPNKVTRAVPPLGDARSVSGNTDTVPEYGTHR